MARTIGSAAALDDIDRRILAELVADGRLAIPALAARVGVSRATAYARFQRLVDTHVIDGFTARVAPDALGLGVVALLMLAVRQGAWPDLSRRLGEQRGREHPEKRGGKKEGSRLPKNEILHKKPCLKKVDDWLPVAARRFRIG